TERLAETFERRIAALVKAADRVRDASDSEAIHDLRVATRRLSVALRVWQGGAPLRSHREAARRLRRLRTRLGRPRELEVHIALLEQRLLGHAEVAPVLPLLKGRLARRRRAAQRRLIPRRVRRLVRALRRAVDDILDRVARDQRSVEATFAVERDTAVAARSAVQAAAEHLDDEGLHRARLLVKKWRYILECLQETLPEAPTVPAHVLRPIQDAL